MACWPWRGKSRSARRGETDSSRAIRPGREIARGLSRRTPGPSEHSLESFLISLGAVALAEVGDKTQLLSLVLAAKYRKPWPICLGVLIATLVNHAIAAEVGAWLAHWLTPEVQRWLIGGSFILVAIWALFPDRADDGAAQRGGHGVFVTTLIAFFLAEMGDRTQIATAILAAQYHPLWEVIAGTTTGIDRKSTRLN